MDEQAILKKFGNSLQKLRKKKDWSQEKLAELASLDRTYISSVERGKRNISIINICKLSKSLGVTPDYLLHEIGGKL